MHPHAINTADLCDRLGDRLAIVELQLRQFGARRAWHGPIATCKVFEDNALVRTTLEQPGRGRVLVVDGGGSLRRALVGDQLAALGLKNGWGGVLVFGAVRDTGTLSGIDFGVAALGTHPRRGERRGEGMPDIPVTFGGVRFVPGHFLYSDDDGTVVSSVPLI
jgi:regulator of ribonuclease activity A